MIPDWITVSEVSGASGETIVTFTASTNDTQSARTATLTIRGTNSGIEKTVTIHQQGVLYMTVTPSTLNVPDSGGTFTITVDTNADEWDALTVPNWVTLYPTGGTSGQTTITATVSYNTGSPRTGNIEFYELQGRVSGTTTVSQTGTTQKLAWVLPSNGQRSVSSGVTSVWWLLEAVDVGEIGIGQMSPMFNSYTITEFHSALYPRATHQVDMYFSENTGEARNGMFTITASTATGYLTGNLAQERGSGGTATLSLSPSAVTVNAASGSSTYTITSTGTITGLSATTNVSWISQPISIVGNNLTVYYQANAGASARTATITLSGNGGAVTATATLKQNVPSPQIIIQNPTAKTITPNTTTVAFIYSVSGAVNNIAPVYTADWITLVTLDGHYLYIYCERNPEDTARTAQIRITGSTATGSVSATAILEQKGESLKLDPSTLIFNYNSGDIKTMSVYTENDWNVIDIEDV